MTLEIEPRTLCVLGKHYTTVMASALFRFYLLFFMYIACPLIFSPKVLHIFRSAYSVAIENDILFGERHSLCCL